MAAAASGHGAHDRFMLDSGSAREADALENGPAAASLLDGWDETQVCEWLAASDPAFEAYVPAFRENNIDGRALGQLSREDLADLGVRSVGHRLAILRARAELHRSHTNGVKR